MRKILLSSAIAVMALGAFVASAQSVAPAYAVYPGQSYCPQLTYNLYRGLSDRHTASQVSQLQYYLGTYFAAEPVPVTGYYGPVTAGFVARFQRDQSVYPITGGVGPLTRAAIARTCGTVTPPSSSTFELNKSFVLTPGKSAMQSQGTLEVTLTSINTVPYTYQMYLPGHYPQPASSASITLGQGCPPGLYCAALWYPTQSVSLTVGQSTTFMGYTVTLQALTASSATFMVSSDSNSSVVTVSSPQTGQAYARGAVLPIVWQSSIKVAGSALVDLYTAAGAKVGTIAVHSYAGDGSFNWTVPTPGIICTLQYPNGLCGQALSGQYYIKVSIVSGSGFDSNAVVFGSAQSGTFTIN